MPVLDDKITIGFDTKSLKKLEEIKDDIRDFVKQIDEKIGTLEARIELLENPGAELN